MLAGKQGPSLRRQPNRRVFSNVGGKFKSNDTISRQHALVKKLSGACFSAWQAVVEAEKHAKLAAADLLADEDKSARSNKSKRSRARNPKKLQIVNDGEVQTCLDDKTLAEIPEKIGVGCSSCCDDCTTNSHGQHEKLKHAKQHYDHGWHKPLDADTADELGSSNDPKQGDSSPLPLIPAHFFGFDAQVRNTFLHIPLPESWAQPEQRRALSAPPMSKLFDMSSAISNGGIG